MSGPIARSLLGAGLACASLVAGAQENNIGPPEALQYPVQADDSAPRAVTGPFLRAAVEQAADLGLCQALMVEDGATFPDGFKDTDCTAAYADKVRDGEGLVHWRSSGSLPTPWPCRQWRHITPRWIGR